MRVEELRVGNLVALEAIGHEDEIVDWSVMDYEFYQGNDNIKPIPLTEEILLDCGFDADYNEEEMSKQFFLFIDSYHLMLESYISDIDGLSFDDSKLCLLMSHPETDQLGVTIYHVHQLQNLFHSLTGQELEFKTLGK